MSYATFMLIVCMYFAGDDVDDLYDIYDDENDAKE